LKHRQESEAAMLTKHQAQLSRQEADNKRIVQILEQRAEAVERNLADANAAAQQLRSEIGRKSLEMRIPSVAHKEQIDALEVKLREQDVLLDSLKQRADTISKRYKEGNLVSNLSKPHWCRYSLSTSERC
jgi:predicted RNase H-like nuclease (RuvC/YqgF family)